jgi:glycine oxidase
MSQQADVLVIGGGVIGLTCAYFLGREGVRVRVVEQGEFGREASWAGAGILPPGNPAEAHTPLDRLRAHSVAMFPELSTALRERTQIDNGYVRCGALEFVAGQAEPVAIQEWRGDGIRSALLDETAARKMEPGLAPGLGQAWHLPDLAQLRNPRHIKALIAGCQSFDVDLQAGCTILGFEEKGGRITSVLSSTGPLAAERVLLTSGAWTGSLLRQLGWKVDIKPVRGQIALVQTPAPVVHRVLLWGPRYLVPRPDGRTLIGSTEEDVGFDHRTTATAIRDLLDLAARLVSALGAGHLEHCWAGLRPGSPDGLPILGQVPGIDNLFIAAGHFRAGIQLSTGTAQLMTELLLNRRLTLPLEPFSLTRFR